MSTIQLTDDTDKFIITHNYPKSGMINKVMEC